MTGWYTTLWQHDHVLVQWLAVAGACLVAAVSDVRSRRIPNVLTLSVLLGGLIFAGSVGGWAGLLDALAGAVVAMTPFVLLFLFAGGGAGDAKMMAAVGAWTGVMGGLLAVGATLLAGGLVAVAMTVALGRGRQVATNVLLLLVALRAALLTRGGAGPGHDQPLPAVALSVMPYGPAMFLGVCAAGGIVLRWQGVL